MKLIKDEHEIQRYLHESDFLNCFSFKADQYVQLFIFDTDDEIAKEGELPEYLYYMVSGQAKLFLTLPNGKTTLIDFFDSPCFIGEMELLGVHHHSRSVQALVPCVCLALSFKLCKDILLEDVHFLRKLSMYLGTKNMRNVSSLAETKTYPLINRFAAFILLASPSGYYREMHTNAAEYLGVSYRHYLYVLADFVNKNYLVKTTKGYQILDKSALIHLAQEMNTHLSVTRLFANME